MSRTAAVLLIVLLVGSLTGQSMLHDFVLCLGADGHVAVETGTGSGGSCGAQSAAQEQGLSAPDLPIGAPAFGLHCGPCRDLAFAQADPMYTRHALPQIGLRAFAPRLSVSLPPTEIDLQSFSALCHPTSYLSASFLACLRSTVLLI